MYKFTPGPYEPAQPVEGQPLTFSQTWTFGDIIYSMIPIRLLGGGEFYQRSPLPDRAILLQIQLPACRRERQASPQRGREMKRTKNLYQLNKILTLSF